jgi:SAM-dependent methyltransferase
MSTTIRSDAVVEASPAEAFAATTEALTQRLQSAGIVLDSERGLITDPAGARLGEILAWEPGVRASLQWEAASWAKGKVALELETAAQNGGTRITATLHGLDGAFDLEADREATAAWFGSEVLTPLLAASTPRSLGDWVTDRGVRKPSGSASRANYRDPMFHWPNFDAILERLQLTASDRLLEVGCGGGAFLALALQSGCSAGAIDHSADMIRVARELNADAIAEGRLELVRSDAERLPFESERFTCAASSGVLAFIADQVGALAEVHRCLVPGGRLVLYTGSPAMRGTPAAPEPFASRLRFVDNDELEALARTAGFAEASVEQPDLTPYATKRGMSGPMLRVFSPKMGQMLIARKAGGSAR